MVRCRSRCSLDRQWSRFHRRQTGALQVFPTVSTIYTLSASNSVGIRTAQTAITLDPGVPVGIPQTLSVIKNTPKLITLSGTDPQNAALSFAIVQAPSQGFLSGIPPVLTYTPNLRLHRARFLRFQGQRRHF